VFAALGAVVLLYVVGRYLLEGRSVPGFPFLASIIAIFSGVQLLATGIIGEYLARVFLRLMDRPTYVIQPNGAAAPACATPDSTLTPPPET
jgi:undecaprenyl-phosphate 4-deoxy-4-formamido-L-arabinose transferase